MAQITQFFSPLRRIIAPNTPIKTLQVTAALNDGGVEQGTLELALYLAKHGYAPQVASAGGAKVAHLEAAKIPHVRLPLHHRNPLALAWNTAQLFRLLWKEHYRIVHARSRGPAWSAWLACALYNRLNPQHPTLFLTAWHGTHGHNWALKRWYNAIMLRGQKVIVISTFLHQHLLTHYHALAERLVVVPRGANPDRFNKNPAAAIALRKELNIPANIPVLVAVGRLTRWKGQHVILQALSQLTDLPWILLLAGEAGKSDAYAKELSQWIADHQMSDRVLMLGSRQDTSELYNLASLALSVATKPEAFGRVAVEAQMCGTPIIASAHGGSLETVQDGVTGWLIPPNDANALATCLRDALTEPQKLAKMGNTARGWALRHFTTQRTCQAEEAVYQSVLKK